MGMTIAEKILAKKGGQAKVVPGDVVTVEVDTVILFDNNFMPSIWREILKLHDPERIVVVLDHRVPAPNQQAAAAHRTGRAFVKQFGIKRFHDVGHDQGISHQLVADHGYALPGSVLVCSDSHTCSAGVFNCLARGVGAPDVMYAATKGETWFRCGETVRYELDGKLPDAVTTKDAFLQIAGTHGAHATQNVEYGGPGIAGLSHQRAQDADHDVGRAVRGVRDVRAGRARCSTGCARAIPRRSSRCTRTPTRTISRCAKSISAASSRWSRCPTRWSTTRSPVEAAAGTRIDQAFIGSCANGTLDDLELAAQVVKGRRVAAGTRFIVTPASQTVYRDAVRSGAIADAGRRRRDDRAADLRRLRRRAHGRARRRTRSASPPARATSRAAWASRARRSTWARRRRSRLRRFAASSPIRGSS